MKKEIDARGQSCPKPLIMTKKALESIEEGIVSTTVDNEVVKENVMKFAKSNNYEATAEEIENGNFIVHVNKNNNKCDCNCEDMLGSQKLKDQTIAISSDKMGKGSDELGKILMKGFIYTLTQITPYPKTILFYNSGINLTTEGSESIDDIRLLEEEGVKVISCGTCLDYFEKADKLKVGEVSNMYSIVEELKQAENTITI